MFPDDGMTRIDLQPEDRLNDRYRLVRRVGQGACAVVWEAVDTMLEETVALKVLPDFLARDERALRRLKEEAKKGLKLHHPHIVRLINFDQDAGRDGLPFLVLEYVAERRCRSVWGGTPKDSRWTSWGRGRVRSRAPSPTRTSKASCTGTSSRRTSSSTRTAAPAFWTSASPGRSRSRARC